MKLLQKISSIVYALFALYWIFRIILSISTFFDFQESAAQKILVLVESVLFLLTGVWSVIAAFKRQAAGWFVIALTAQLVVLSLIYSFAPHFLAILPNNLSCIPAILIAASIATHIHLAPSHTGLIQKIAAITYAVFTLFWTWLLIKGCYFSITDVTPSFTQIAYGILTGITTAIIVFICVWMTMRAFKSTAHRHPLLGALLPAAQTALLAWVISNKHTNVYTAWYLSAHDLGILDNGWMWLVTPLFFAIITLIAAAALNILKKTEPTIEAESKEGAPSL